MLNLCVHLDVSYNNLLDLEAALGLALEFSMPVAVAVKHNNPCGVGVDSDPVKAMKKALSADPVSVFGGVVAFNRPVREVEAQALGEIFLECILAPSFTPEALTIFSKKKNLRILESATIFERSSTWEMKLIQGGFVVQNRDHFGLDKGSWKIYGEPVTPDVEMDIFFGEKVCGFLKSNSIAIVRGGQTLGLGMGQVNRVDAVEQAIKRMKTHHPRVTDGVLVSDAFFPFPDSIELAARAGLRVIAQPGGSVKDEDVIQKSQEHGMQMILTGTRHFRH